MTKGSRNKLAFLESNNVRWSPGTSTILIPGHRRRQTASAPSLEHVRRRTAGARSTIGSRSSDPLHAATSLIKSRMLNSRSKIGSIARIHGRRPEGATLRNTLVSRRPASRNDPRQNRDRRNRPNSSKRRFRSNAAPACRARPFHPAMGEADVVTNVSIAQKPPILRPLACKRRAAA